MGTKGISDQKITPWLVTLGGVVMLLLVWALIGVEMYTSRPEYVRNSMLKVIPKGAILRDYVKMEDTKVTAYLLIYVEKGYTMEDVNAESLMSCPGEINGQPIRGNYHLGLFENNKLVNEVPIPGEPYDNTGELLPLVYRNTKGNIYSDPNRPDKLETEVVPLLVLKDYTGDSLPFEFLLKTTEGGCGFWDGLVGGYDPETNKAVIYSDWIQRLSPDDKGYFHYLFDCGDHGNDVKVEQDYQFSPAAKRFIQTSEKKTSCSA
jgi:hypothetical protein